MSKHGDAEWLGIGARSESDQPHEWRAIMWAIRNRVEKAHWYPNTYEEVVLMRRQFSYFDQWTVDRTLSADAIFEAARAGYAGDHAGWRDDDLSEAIECARAVLEEPRWRAPFGPRVLLYWSPVSMRGHQPPSWAKGLKQVVAPGVDPWRFTFAIERRD